ncbi:MAG TPA: O-antigen ligase family protein [Ramlibacter sp.]|nr:O-antigen ligase family protein [Ramlibacter sp.]
MAAHPSRDGAAAWLLALTLFFAVALGVPGTSMLQDTFKSAGVGFGALFAALAFFLARRRGEGPVQWHAVLLLPLLLVAHALSSMAWSHAYLAGVEAVRWFVFALVAWLALNTFSRERLPLLAACVHAAAVAASAWAALQFWFGFDLFAQRAQPASTFGNRNFFAEFAVCTLPFGLLVLARARTSAQVFLQAAGIGLVVVAVLMTGTRSALLALWLQVLVVLPLLAWRCRAQLPWSGWSGRWRALGTGAFAGTVLLLVLVPSVNPRILADGHGASPLLRGAARTLSIGLQDPSLNLRIEMWRATLDAIRDRPLAGLGAGAWENEIPRYLPQGAQLETDYYAHNEPLQLAAEYGLAGWAVLLLLAAYLLQAAWRTWRDDGALAQAERPWRAGLLAALLALMIVSTAGFPWRLAATGALFALCLGALAASDARLGYRGLQLRAWNTRPAAAYAGMALTAVALGLAALVTQRAAESERKLLAAVRTARAISAAGDPDHPRHAAARAEVLRLVREGSALNPHYRKLTPQVADELARWGDWRNAIPIWEGVLASRPNVVAILTNTARGYASLGQMDRTTEYLERARRLQPRAASVHSLEVVLLARSGQEGLALQKAREALAAGIADHDLVNAAFLLSWRAGNIPQALRLLDQRMTHWPETRALGLVQMGLIHAAALNDPRTAMLRFSEGLALATPAERPALREQIPPHLRMHLP